MDTQVALEIATQMLEMGRAAVSRFVRSNSLSAFYALKTKQLSFPAVVTSLNSSSFSPKITFPFNLHSFLSP
jgi:hypothetical protein